MNQKDSRLLPALHFVVLVVSNFHVCVCSGHLQTTYQLSCGTSQSVSTSSCRAIRFVLVIQRASLATCLQRTTTISTLSSSKGRCLCLCLNVSVLCSVHVLWTCFFLSTFCTAEIWVEYKCIILCHLFPDHLCGTVCLQTRDLTYDSVIQTATQNNAV